MTIPPIFTVTPHPELSGVVTPPGDKSISHRALMLAALAPGRSTISGLSHGEDVQHTGRIVAALGATVGRDGDLVTVTSTGVLRASPQPLDCGNSGTTMRLVAGLVAGVAGEHTLVGDASLSKRPMDRVQRPLALMGARLSGHGARILPPIALVGAPLRGITYDIPEPSAQVKSAILLAGLGAVGPTTVHESVLTRTHTEEMLLFAGADLTVVEAASGRTLTVIPGPLEPRHWEVASDPSQAAFAVVAALLASTGSVHVRNLYPGRERTSFLDVLERMGAGIERSPQNGMLDVRVTASVLRGTTITGTEIPSLDEVPILAVAALRAEGTTRFVDVGELRLKESDRLLATAALVAALGGRAEIVGDDLIVHGGVAQVVHAVIDPLGDHRLAMAGAIGGLSAARGSTVTVTGASCIATSYPTFLEDLAGIGVHLEGEMG